MKILIVEPDEYYHSQFRSHIGPVAELRFSRGAAEALQISKAESFDMIVTELILADGHAYDFLPKLESTPVVIYTRASHLEDVEALLNLGAAACFIKGQDTINDIKKLVLNSQI